MRFKITIISILYLIQALFSQTAKAPTEGDGSEDSPYQIESWENLYWISQDTSQWKKHFIQTSDIKMPQNIIEWDSGAGWTPIGTKETNFQGTYNGKGHIIDSLFIKRDSSRYIGLFGLVEGSDGAFIESLNVTNLHISAKTDVGGLIGNNKNGSTILHCSVTGKINGHSENIGGLIGANQSSEIYHCFSILDISSEGISIGGLIGNNFDNSYISNCHSIGNIEGSQRVGGLVGSNRKSNIEISLSSGQVYGGKWYTGGLIGQNSDTCTITQCFSTSNTIASGESVGGLIGFTTKALITDCYSTGNVQGTKKVGGLIGYNYDQSGSIIGGGKSTSSTIKNCYSIGTVSGDEEIGGLIGDNSKKTLACFWDTETSELEISEGGIGLSTDKMKNYKTYTDSGWNFYSNASNENSNVWGMNDIDNNGYPFLMWQGFESTVNIYNDNISTIDSQFFPIAISNKHINFNSKEKYGTFKIYNYQGRLLIKKLFEPNKDYKLDLSRFASGLYCFKISIKEEREIASTFLID